MTKKKKKKKKKKKEGQCSATLTQQAYLNYMEKENFCGTQREIPSRQDRAILPTRVANHSAGFGHFFYPWSHKILLFTESLYDESQSIVFLCFNLLRVWNHPSLRSQSRIFNKGSWYLWHSCAPLGFSKKKQNIRRTMHSYYLHVILPQSATNILLLLSVQVNLYL